MTTSSITHGVVIRPGDTLLVAFAGARTDEELAEVGALLRPALPDTVKIVAINADQLAVYRPEPGAPCDPA